MSCVRSTYRKKELIQIVIEQTFVLKKDYICLLYTSDAADE